MKEFILMLHPTFGVLATLAGVWVFVELLNLNEGNVARMRSVTVLLAVFMWIAYIIGGYWYVVHYGADKAIIKAGPWVFAHGLFMETKEHLFFTLLLLSTYLPIAAYALTGPGAAGGRLLEDKSARTLVLTVTALIVLLGLAMEGEGAVVGLGVRMGLMQG